MPENKLIRKVNLLRNLNTLKENSMGHKKDKASDASVEEASSSDASASASDSSDKKSKKSKKKSTKKDKKDKKDKKGKDKKSTHKKDKKGKKDKKDKKDKKEKSSKSGKRGPRDAQWKTWKQPYQPGSITHQLAQDMMKKGGMKSKDFVKKCKKLGGNPAFMLRVIGRGETKGFRWEFDDSHDRYRITNVKKDPKAYR